MSTVGRLRELGAQSAGVIARFERIEPRRWTEEVLVLELCGEVGSLTHALLAVEGYKRCHPRLADVKDECADVLFILLRLAHYRDLSLPQGAQTPAPPGAGCPPTVVGMGLELSRLAGRAAAGANAGKSFPLPEMLRIVALLESIARHYRFSLRDAYLAELNVCRLWQVKCLASSLWLQRLRRWLRREGA
jgi:NTP pyrophosphatase (non-canonical NTP hydrolase)